MKKMVLTTLLLSSVALFACQKKQEEGTKLTGKLSTLPTFSIPSLWGGTCTPKDYLGKPAIVEVWSYRCPHCRHQAKYFEELAKDLDFSKYAIVSIHSGGGERVKDEVAKHFTNKKIQVCLDDGSYSKALRTLPKELQIRGIPHMYVVNAKGEVTEILRGARPASVIRKKLQSLK